MGTIKRMRAFTLLEVIVVMVISGIVLSMAMTAFVIIQRQFDNFRERGGEVFQVQRVHSLIVKDLSDAAIVNSDGNNLALQMPDGEVLTYRFNGGALTRAKGSQEDTLATGVSIPVVGYAKTLASDALVSQVSFTMENGGKAYLLSFYKAYSPADIINTEQ